MFSKNDYQFFGQFSDLFLKKTVFLYKLQGLPYVLGFLVTNILEGMKNEASAHALHMLYTCSANVGKMLAACLAQRSCNMLAPCWPVVSHQISTCTVLQCFYAQNFLGTKALKNSASTDLGASMLSGCCQHIVSMLPACCQNIVAY